MDRSLKWRTIALLLSVLACLAMLAPTWPGSNSLPSWFPFRKKISLGLDLQGGMHIVYSIDLDRAVDDKASEIKRELESRYIDEKVDAKVLAPLANPTADPPVPLGSVTVIPADAAKKAELESQIKAEHGEAIENRPCPAADGPNAICFHVSTSYAEGIKKAALTNAVTTIRDRIDEKGVAEPSVVEKGDDIIVELPGDPESEIIRQTRDIIKRTAKLEFKVVEENSAYMQKIYGKVGSVGKEGTASDPKAIELEIRAEIDQWTPDDGRRRTDYFLLAPDRDEQVSLEWAKKSGCYNANSVVRDGKLNCRIQGRQLIDRYIFGDKQLGYKGLVDEDPTFKMPESHQLVYERITPEAGAKDERVHWRSYYVQRAVRLGGSAIANAMGSNDPNTGQPVVLIDFNRYGSRVFGDLTAEIVGRKLATILDDKIASAPYINGAIRGGRASITMGGGSIQRQEADREELVNVLKTGSLPAPLFEQSHMSIGPTLGGDAIDKTKVSFMVGVVLVVVIMIGIYKWSGWIAVFAVLFHVLLTLAVMALFSATLTLPGVAAVVLSVGMTVDGNILIYERIRDELLLGKSVRGAIDLGFSRAFSAILDGQLTTAAAGWVLLQYGSGPIKGFAVMLLVGVFTTLSTNIWVTRILFDWYVSRKKGQLATISI